MTMIVIVSTARADGRKQVRSHYQYSNRAEVLEVAGESILMLSFRSLHHVLNVTLPWGSETLPSAALKTSEKAVTV